MKFFQIKSSGGDLPKKERKETVKPVSKIDLNTFKELTCKSEGEIDNFLLFLPFTLFSFCKRPPDKLAEALIFICELNSVPKAKI
jgi:hypothetical protein